MRTLVLASTSPYRRRLLQQLRLPFQVATPRFEENLQQGVSPELLVKHLAVGKAKSLVRTFPDALIIGSDQVFVDPRGRILGKAGTREKAVRQLIQMAGRSHTFYTGLTVFDARDGRHLVEATQYSVTLRDLSEEEIRDYVDKENPVDCAGSFKVEGLGIALMERMEGDDFNSLIGLPLIRLVHMLEHFGVKVFDTSPR